VIQYAITNGTAAADEKKWIDRVARCLERGVDLLQIRERDLSARRLADLTRKVLALPNPQRTKILINDRADVAVACGAHGVHLRDGSVPPEYFARPGFTVTASCHDISGLNRTRGADFVLLAPIFTPRSKTDARPPLGLAVLREAARISPVPVIALGGVSAQTAPACMAAGAAGIAGISYFDYD
jgi:thiamine-phosphate pyrophosphorylase